VWSTTRALFLFDFGSFKSIVVAIDIIRFWPEKLVDAIAAISEKLIFSRFRLLEKIAPGEKLGVDKGYKEHLNSLGTSA
jgi:hypothetical protein